MKKATKCILHFCGRNVTVAGLSNNSLHGVEIGLQVVNGCMLGWLFRCHIAENARAPGGQWLAAGESRFSAALSRKEDFITDLKTLQWHPHYDEEAFCNLVWWSYFKVGRYKCSESWSQRGKQFRNRWETRVHTGESNASLRQFLVCFWTSFLAVIKGSCIP